MFYICLKFHQNIWNDFQLIEQTRVYSRSGYFQYLLSSKGFNSKSRLTRVTVFVFCTLSHGALHLWEVSWKRTVFNLKSGQEYAVEMAMFNVQRGITLKVGKPELRFMCSAHHLIVLYIYVKFDKLEICSQQPVAVNFQPQHVWKLPWRSSRSCYQFSLPATSLSRNVAMCTALVIGVQFSMPVRLGHWQSQTSNVCSGMTGQWIDRSAMSSHKTLSSSGPMGYLCRFALRIWTFLKERRLR